MERVRAILWKKLGNADMGAITGSTRARTRGGSGQPDMRFPRTKISDAAILEFVNGTASTRAVATTPPNVLIDLRPLPGQSYDATTDQIQIKDFGPSRAEHSMRQPNGYNNQRWSDVASNGSVGDYVYVLRLEDGTFTTGWVRDADVAALPGIVRVPLQENDRGIRFYMQASLPGLVGRILQALQQHHNVLLYGPPGTGKTYLMQQVLQAFRDPPPSIPLFDPGTDTFATEEAPVVAPGKTVRDWRWTTFHQSYSYETFIGSRQPSPTPTPGSLLNLVPVDGILVTLAKTATEPNGASLLVIDEINRGNVSRIFGEFITLMEPDKRLRKDGTSDPVRTVSVRLPYTGDEFRMPYHVYTLASMNSVDRSVMPLDAALRRRFHIIELAPDYDTLVRDLFGLTSIDSQAFRAGPQPERAINPIGHYAWFAARLLSGINDFIRAYLGPDFEAGHGFYSTIGNAVGGDADALRDAFIEVWNNRLLPHLLELFRTQSDRLGQFLRVDDTDKPDRYPYKKQRLPGWMVGGVAGLETPALRPDDYGEAALRYVGRIP